MLETKTIISFILNKKTPWYSYLPASPFYNALHLASPQIKAKESLTSVTSPVKWNLKTSFEIKNKK